MSVDNVIIFVSSAYLFAHCSWSRWREKELAAARDRAEQLASTGYVLLDDAVISNNSKLSNWKRLILPILAKHWSKVHRGFDISSPNTWPQPQNGREYSSTYKQPISGLLPLFSSNYEVQSTIAYLFDPKMRNIEFGVQSHWKYSLLSCSSLFSYMLNILSGGFLWTSIKSGNICISGEDQSWILVNWPNSIYGIAGQAIPNGAHIDAGKNNCYSYGLPMSAKDTRRYFTATPTATATEYSSRALLSMLCEQLAIMFYCHSPGKLGMEEGVTGFYPYSHLALLYAIKSALENSDKEITIDQKKLLNMLKYEYGNAFTPVQVEIPEGKCLLAFGSLVHTTMWATKPMSVATPKCKSIIIEEYPRCISNCKIFTTECWNAAEEKWEYLWSNLPCTSLMHQLCMDPLAFLSPPKIGPGISDIQATQKSEITQYLKEKIAELVTMEEDER